MSSVDTVEIDSHPQRDRFLVPFTTGSIGPKSSSGGESSAVRIKLNSGLRGPCIGSILSTTCLVFDLRASALSARNDDTDGRSVREGSRLGRDGVRKKNEGDYRLINLRHA